MPGPRRVPHPLANAPVMCGEVGEQITSLGEGHTTRGAAEGDGGANRRSGSFLVKEVVVQVELPFRVDRDAAELAAAGLPGVDAHAQRGAVQGHHGAALRGGRPTPPGREKVSARYNKEASSGLGVADAVRRRAEQCSAVLVASANLKSRIADSLLRHPIMESAAGRRGDRSACKRTASEAA